MPSPTSPRPEHFPDAPGETHPTNHSRIRRRPFPRRPYGSPHGQQPEPTPAPQTTTNPARRPGESGSADEGWEIADLIAAGVLDVVPGDPPVPVSVWRATPAQDAPVSPAALYRGLTPSLAARLLAIYTDPGQTVIDITGDPAIAGAAGAGARRYLSFDLADVDLAARDLRGDVGLILLRWPPLTPPATVPGRGAGPDPRAVLEACAALLGADGHTVVILAPPSGGVYRDYARTIIPTARRAGLGYLQHVVVITIDTISPRTSTRRTHTDATVGENASASPPVQEHLDLLVFILRQGTHP
jgi:hypothetical protein